MTQPDLEKLAEDCAKSIIPAGSPCYAEDVDAAIFHIKEAIERATESVRDQCETYRLETHRWAQAHRCVEAGELKRLAERFNCLPEQAVTAALAFATTTDGVLNNLRAQLAAASAQLRKNAEQYYNVGVVLGVADPEHYSLEDAVDDLRGQLTAASERMKIVELCRDSVNQKYGHARNSNDDSEYLLWLSKKLNEALRDPAAMAQQKGGG